MLSVSTLTTRWDKVQMLCGVQTMLYSFMWCVEGSGARRRSTHCPFKQYPSHPHFWMRSPCGTLLLKNVELATRKTYLYPFLMYCYLGIDSTYWCMYCITWIATSLKRTPGKRHLVRNCLPTCSTHGQSWIPNIALSLPSDHHCWVHLSISVLIGTLLKCFNSLDQS